MHAHQPTCISSRQIQGIPEPQRAGRQVASEKSSGIHVSTGRTMVPSGKSDAQGRRVVHRYALLAVSSHVSGSPNTSPAATKAPILLSENRGITLAITLLAPQRGGTTIGACGLDERVRKGTVFPHAIVTRGGFLIPHSYRKIAGDKRIKISVHRHSASKSY